jgi:hypothetical protein
MDIASFVGKLLEQDDVDALREGVRVLAQAVDSTGNVVGQRIGYVPGGVGGFGRAYFVVSNLPVTDNYRVSVWDYTWFQAPKDPR